MVINDEWRKCNPINDILQPRENLLWIGRPNQEIYVRGNRTRRGYITYAAWTILIFSVTVTSLAYGSVGTGGSVGIQIFFDAIMLAALLIFNYIAFAPANYKRAPWYAFSEKRIFLVVWDDDDLDFAIYETELSNLTDITVRESKNAPKEKGTGNIVCQYERSVRRRFTNHFTFELIGYPAEVKALLLGAKAGCTV